jgi:hypothetical protein
LLAEQETTVPLFFPVQVQVHGPDPETVLAVEVDTHKLVVGAVFKFAPLDEPQALVPTLLAAQSGLLVPP